MFDVYKTTQETRVVDRNVTITEKRAPTDESVKLLKEMEEAVRNKITSSINVSNTSFECVLHGWMDFLNDKYHLKAIFKINGEKEEALVRREKQMTELTKYIQENLVQISWGRVRRHQRTISCSTWCFTSASPTGYQTRDGKSC